MIMFGRELMANVAQRFWQESIHTSKPYRLALILQFTLNFILNWMITHAIIDDPAQVYRDILLRSLLEATVFLVLCHFLLRSYLRLYIINNITDLKQISLGFLFVLVLSGFSLGASIMIGQIELVAATNIGQMQLIDGEGNVEGRVNPHIFTIVGTLEVAAVFIAWSLIYLAWYLQRNRWELQKTVRDAQIQQLGNQLSPHFLFNTLNSIRALIYQDKDTAADLVTKLSDLFRTHMRSQIKVKSSLAEELEVTNSYISIEKSRLQDRLTYETDIDPACVNEELPTLTLLTLVENSIKHGISTSSKPGLISVYSARKGDNRWVLVVSNSVYNAVQQPGTRIGLANVRKRLALQHGREHSFRVSHRNQVFSVEMELPYAGSVDC